MFDFCIERSRLHRVRDWHCKFDVMSWFSGVLNANTLFYFVLFSFIAKLVEKKPFLSE